MLPMGGWGPWADRKALRCDKCNHSYQAKRPEKRDQTLESLKVIQKRIAVLMSRDMDDPMLLAEINTMVLRDLLDILIKERELD